MTATARQIEGPGQLSAVQQREVPTPKRGELLLRVHATSVNYHDFIGVSGGIPGLPVPRVPFSDGSAIVEAVGEDAHGFAVGDHVVPNFFPYWRGGEPRMPDMGIVLGDQVDGTLQSHVCVPATGVVRAPANLDHAGAATLGCAGLTAWRSLVVEGNIKPGQTVLIQGTGGVSLFALGFAKMLGARAIVTSSSDAKLERARALGADVTINYRDKPEWANEVLAATGGVGADLVVEVGGGNTLAQAVMAVKLAGHISVIGVLSGFMAESFPFVFVMQKNIAVKGITVGNVTDLDAMCRAIELHGYQPVVDQRFTLETAHEAIETLKGQGHFGKIVIEIP